MGMIDVSKPLGEKGLGKYHKRDFAAESSKYYSENKAFDIGSFWHGQLADQFQLSGSGQVGGDEFIRAAKGQHPVTEEQLIRWKNGKNQEDGKESGHRAAWDYTFHPDKSVTLTALHDPRIYFAQRQAVKYTADRIEEYAMGRFMTHNESTGNLLMAAFEHNTARPVNGVYDPHLHTHLVIFNMTRDSTGRIRSLQTSEMARGQKMGIWKAHYQNELHRRLKELGYDVRIGKNGAPVIHGYGEDYLKDMSRRHDQIKEKAKDEGVEGNRKAESQIAHKHREKKMDLSPEETARIQREREQMWNNPHEPVLADMRARAGQDVDQKLKLSQHQSKANAQEAVSSAIRKLSERLSVFDERQLMAEALWMSQGKVFGNHILENIRSRVQTPEQREKGVLADLNLVTHDTYDVNKPGFRYASRETILAEERVLKFTSAGREIMQPIAFDVTPEFIKNRFQHLNGGLGLNKDQINGVVEQLISKNKAAVTVGAAGVGKTSSVLFPIQTIARERGYEVVSTSPTTKAAKQMQKDGMINSMTLSRYLFHDDDWLKKQGIDTKKPRLLILDEASMAGTVQYERALARVFARPLDRILIVGDTRQHGSVEAGRPLEAQLEAGLEYSRIDTLVRPRNLQMLEIGRHLQWGKSSLALNKLADPKFWPDHKSRVAVGVRRDTRLERMVADYMKSPKTSLVISPDNRTRQDLNKLIREQLRKTGQITGPDKAVKVLVNRQELTKEDMKYAEKYQPRSASYAGDMVRFGRGSAKHGIKAGSYARVVEVNPGTNQVKVELNRPIRPGETSLPFYVFNPKTDRIGAQLLQEQDRSIAAGDQMVFKGRIKLGNGVIVTNGQEFTVDAVDKDGNIQASTEGGKKIRFNAAQVLEMEYRYATTSYSSQSLTVDNVVIHMDTGDKTAAAGISMEMFYVAATRARFDIHIHTDDMTALKQLLVKQEPHVKAMDPLEITKFFKKYPAPVAAKEMREYILSAESAQRKQATQGYGAAKV